MKHVVSILRKAAELIAGKPHLAKRIRTDSEGCYCLIGAIEAANPTKYESGNQYRNAGLREKDNLVMTGMVGKYLGFSDERKSSDLCCGYKGLLALGCRAVDWNNLPSTTQEQVVSALRETADAIEEGRLDGR